MLFSSKCRILLYLNVLLVFDNGITALPSPKISNIGEKKVKPTQGKIIIPAMARKAGGRLRPQLQEGVIPDATKEEKKLGDVQHNEEAYDYSVWSSSSEEIDCPKRMYYHTRGKQCVPLRCPGGNRQRSQMFGDCLPVLPEFYGSTGRVMWQGHGQGLIAQNGHSRLSPSVWRRTRYYEHRNRYMRG